MSEGGGVDAIGHEAHVLCAESPDTFGDFLVDRDDAARPGQGEGLHPAHGLFDNAGGAGRFRRIRPDVGCVPDVGDRPERQGGPGDEPGRGRRFNEDDPRAPVEQETEEKGNVEGKVGQVSAQVSALVSKDRPAGDPNPPFFLHLLVFRRRGGQGLDRDVSCDEGAFNCLDAKGSSGRLGHVDPGRNKDMAARFNAGAEARSALMLSALALSGHDFSSSVIVPGLRRAQLQGR